MKKIAASLIIFIILLFQTPALAAVGTTISSTNSDKVEIARDLKIDKPVPGDVIVIMGNLDIQADVQGDVVVIMGDVTVNARVSGDIVTVLGKATIEENAEIEGGLIAIGEVERANGAKILGEDISISLGFLPMKHVGINSILIGLVIIWSVFVLLIGLVAITIAKSKFENISSGIYNNVGKRLALGLLFFAVAFLLVLTVIGIPLYLLVLILAEVVVCTFFGKILLGNFKSSTNIYLEFFTGFVILTLVKLVPIIVIPYNAYTLFGAYIMLQVLFGIFVYSFGIGTLINTKFGSKYNSNNNANK